MDLGLYMAFNSFKDRKKTKQLSIQTKCIPWHMHLGQDNVVRSVKYEGEVVFTTVITFEYS